MEQCKDTVAVLDSCWLNVLTVRMCQLFQGSLRCTQRAGWLAAVF